MHFVRVGSSDRHKVLLSGKNPVVPEPRAASVRRYDPEVVCSMARQAADVGGDIAICIPSLNLHRRVGPITRRGSVFEMDGGI